MKTKQIAVLMGGWSSEREVSLTSGQGVLEALKTLGYNATAIDVKKNLPQLLKDIETAKPDIIFNALHGTGGEDGVIQGVLEFLEIPYTHSNVTASAVGMDKLLSKHIFIQHDLPVPKFKILTPHNLQISNPFPFPYVIKPIADGSTVGVFIIHNAEDHKNALKNWKFGDKILVEEYIPGRDIFVPILNGKAMGIVEVRPHSGFYDYEAKYTENKAEHLVPAPMPPEDYQKALEISEIAHEVLGCRGVTRTDFRYDDTGPTPRLYLLEINTQPGLTPLSLVPDVTRTVGIDYPELIELILKSATCDKDEA